MTYLSIRYAFDLPEGDLELKKLLGINPTYTRDCLIKDEPHINPLVSDRAGYRGYNRVYSRYVSHLRKEKLNILEIGIESGHSLVCWSKYFYNSNITGVEIDITQNRNKKYNRLRLEYEEFNRVRIIQADSTIKDEWKKFEGEYDIIIDDGSHDPLDQVTTLKNAWPHLKKGGYYFAEDITEAYLRSVGLDEHKKRLNKLYNTIYKVSKNNHAALYKHVNLRSLNNKTNRYISFPAYDYILVIKKETDEIPG